MASTTNPKEDEEEVEGEEGEDGETTQLEVLLKVEPFSSINSLSIVSQSLKPVKELDIFWVMC